MSRLLAGSRGSPLAVLLAVGLVLGSMPGMALSPEAGEPEGVHLSFTEDPQTTLTVTWFTQGTQDSGSTVEYGDAPDQLDRTATGTSHPNPESGGFLVHEATMTGLDPGQIVHYRVGGDSGFSPVYETQTAPEASQPVRVAAFGDQGTSPPAEQVTQAVLEEDPDVVLVPGDLANAGAEWWDWHEWFAMNEELFASTPLMPAMGEQETIGPHGASSYLERVALPDAERYYSFDYGPVHVLVLATPILDTGADGSLDDMLAFAQADLAQAAEARQEGEIGFIAVQQHRPLYANHEEDTRQHNPELAAWEEQLFDRYGVDLVLTGHNHHYERSYPMLAGLPTSVAAANYEDPVGWIQVITGGGGSELHPFQHRDDFWPHAAAWEQAHHYVVVDAQGTTLELAAQTPDEDPPLDAFSLEVTQPPPTIP